MKRIFLFAMMVLLITGFYFIKQTVFAQANPVTENSQQTILNATVQINMKAPLLDESGQPRIAETDGRWHTVDEMAHGLGTLVRIEDQIFVVTHDHWGSLLNTAVTIQFQNAQGQLLAELAGDSFRSQIVYQDQGTMIFKAADELKPIFHFAITANSQFLAASAEVTLTRHQPGTEMVEVVTAQVTAVTSRKGVPAYHLTNLDGSIIVEGDSGGGIWFQGQLVGNLWRNVAIETVQMEAGVEASTNQQITASSIVAAYPNLTALSLLEALNVVDPLPQRQEPITP